MVIYWCSAAEDNRFFLNVKEPDPLFKSIKNNFSFVPEKENFLKCPSVNNYIKNTFVLKSPVSLDLELVSGGITIPQYDMEFCGSSMQIRYADEFRHFLSIKFLNFLFFTEDDCTMDFTKAYLSESDFSKKTMVLPGSLNISKWFRPTDLAFFVNQGVEKINIQEDDPLAYVRFNTNKPIKLKKFYLSRNLNEMVNYVVKQKNFMQDKSVSSYFNRAYHYFEQSKLKNLILKEIKNNLME